MALPRHGHFVGNRASPTYSSWSCMKSRCLYPRDKEYKNYGARGIKICLSWLIFENFLAEMGPRPRGKTLDRRDTNGDYTPWNCRWATMKQQCLSRRPHSAAHREHQREAMKKRYAAGIHPFCKIHKKRREHDLER